MRSVAVLVGCVVAWMAGMTAVASAAGKVIGEVLRPTPVSAYAGHVVFSAWDPAVSQYRLMLSVDGLRPAPVDVAPRGVPFDADIGPGPGGGVHAIYSRCAKEPIVERVGNVLPAWNTGKGCDLFRVDLMTGSERRIPHLSSSRASEFLPTIWRYQVAFARRRDASVSPRLYRASLASERAARRLPGGRRGTGRTLITAGQPVGVDLRDGRVAHVWNRKAGRSYRSTLRSVTGGGSSRRLASVPARVGIGELMTPIQESKSSVVSGHTRLSNPQLLLRFVLGRPGQTSRRAVGAQRLVLGVARDRAVLGTRGTYVLDAPPSSRSLGAAGQCSGSGGRCRIIKLAGDPFDPSSDTSLPGTGTSPGGAQGDGGGLLDLPPLPKLPIPAPQLPTPQLPVPLPQITG